MTNINPNLPHLVFEIGVDGSITSEAKHYPNTAKTCQGELATEPFETALSDEGLIPPVNRIERKYKTNSGPIQTNRQQQTQQ